MTSTDSAKKLSPETLALLKQELAENGYSVIRGVVSKEPLSEFNARLAEAYDRSRKFAGGGTIVGHLNCFPGEAARFIYDELEDYGIVEAVRAMRHGKRCNLRAQVNYNLPGSSPQHYHMDSLFADEFLLCNVAIVDTDEINGAIDVLPTTNREFYPYWRFALERKSKLSTRVVLEQGDLVVRTSNLWHRGMPNKTGTVRPMMALLFGEAGTQEGDPFQAYGSDIFFYPNWYSNETRLGILQERIESVLPVTRSAYRFGKSLLRSGG
jgi:hypothetical protein